MMKTYNRLNFLELFFLYQFWEQTFKYQYTQQIYRLNVYWLLVLIILV